MSIGSTLSTCHISMATGTVVTSYSRYTFKMHTGQSYLSLLDSELRKCLNHLAGGHNAHVLHWWSNNTEAELSSFINFLQFSPFFLFVGTRAYVQNHFREVVFPVVLATIFWFSIVLWLSDASPGSWGSGTSLSSIEVGSISNQGT